ncbi:hypothetical protein N7539_008728 [Penicillium diatomitis]|uniref:Uncharacterized protein n=1 Tax=Penicillium diatomitis TaxID=2819901 RepID=A0A9W9WR83_9EURO|nr:uncharacterized protein N7539_008728 [Penicillium diatomitis]KAJ5472159.1 hypothetical protein N7539_008728 [Penicillium diatomitis]
MEILDFCLKNKRFSCRLPSSSYNSSNRLRTSVLAVKLHTLKCSFGTVKEHTSAFQPRKCYWEHPEAVRRHSGASA